MLKRFLRYYRPHIPLFILDMAAAVVMAGLSILFPYLTRTLLKTHIPQKDLSMIVWILAAMMGIYLTNLVLNYIRMKWGHIMSRISNDLNMIAEVAHHAPEDLLISLFVIIGAYIFMCIFSLPLALISLIPLPFMLVWGLLLGGRMRQGFRRVRKEIAEINRTVENSVQGIREVKAFANEQLEEDKFKSSNTNFRFAKEEAYTVMARFHAGIHFLRDLYYLVVVGGGVLLIFRGVVEVYDLLSFILYVGIILPPIDRLINFNEQIQQGTAAFERFV